MRRSQNCKEAYQGRKTGEDPEARKTFPNFAEMPITEAQPLTVAQEEVRETKTRARSFRTLSILFKMLYFLLNKTKSLTKFKQKLS